MGTNSKVQWCHHTFNGWIGCEKISPACKNCYAAVETFPRVQRANGRELWGRDADRHVTSDANWRKPFAWNTAATEVRERHRVFCSSLSDVFEDRPDLVQPRLRLWTLITATPQLDWLLLTKRPQNIAGMLPEDWGNGYANVWLGTTCEDQQRADERIPHLLSASAAVRFLSIEPQLGPIDLTRLHDEEVGARWNALKMGIHWVIIGGESGPGARPFQIEWARSIAEQCQAAGVACFVKQLGACASDEKNGIAGAALEVPDEAVGLISRRLRDKKGGAIEEWPLDLQVRQFPEVRA